MITDYVNFNYNKNFLYNHNIFKNNYNVGIGTFTPNNSLDIYGNVFLNNNITIKGNLNLIKHTFNDINIITYNNSSQQIKPLKLLSYNNSWNTNQYNWNHDNDNLHLDIYDQRDNINLDYQSKPISIYSNNTYQNIKLYNQSKTVIDSIYIYNNNNTYENLSNLKINDISLTRIKDHKYLLNNKLIFENNSHISININNINITNQHYKIHFLGYYDFIKGQLWNSYNDNSIHINSNISILTNKNNQTLNLNGTFTNDKNLIINKDLYSDKTIINGLLVNKGTTNVKSLMSTNNKFYINKNKQKLGIGTLTLTDDINIGSSVKITNDGIVKTQNTICDKIILNENLFPNSDFFKINEQQIKFKNINIFKPASLNTKHKDTIIYIDNNLNINNHDLNSFYNHVNVKGIIKVDDLHITKNFKIATLNNSLQLNHLKTQIITNEIIKSNFLKTKQLNSHLINLHTLNLNTKNNNKIGSIYYNPDNNLYYGKIKNHTVSFMKTQFKNTYSNAKIIDSNYTLVDKILVNNIKINKTLILPKTDIYKNYQNNFSRTKVGALQYNINSLYAEIYNGYKWSKIKYINSDSEIKNISINYSKNSLNPTFNPRIQNYQCHYNNSILPYSLYISNSPLHKIIIKKDNSVIFTKINNTNDFQPINYVLTNTIIDNNNNINIKSEKINDTNININYNIKFKYI